MRLAWHFRDPALLEQALTHGSYANERVGIPHNERLEFLGDAVVEVLVSELLYQRFPQWPEGALTQARALLVKEETLANIAKQIGVGAELRLGIGAETTGGRQLPRVLADALEALVGAAFVDGGIGAARSLFSPLILPEIEKLDAGPNAAQHLKDARSTLQEFLAKRRRGEAPKYHVVAETGPEHQRRFEVEVEVDGVRYGPAEGVSKKEAFHRAAEIALRALRNP